MTHERPEVEPHNPNELRYLGQIAVGGLSGAGVSAFGSALVEQIVDSNIMGPSAVGGAIIGTYLAYRHGKLYQ